MAVIDAPETVTIDGKHYKLADLSDTARHQLQNVRFVDGQLQLLANRKAVTETAKAAYSQSLVAQLPEKKAAANKKNGVVTVDGSKYRLEDFSDAGKAQLANIQFTEQELSRLSSEKAVTDTARKHYAGILAGELQNIAPMKTQ